MAHTLHRFLATASGALDLASDATSLKSVKDAFKSASILLTTIMVGFLLSAFFDCQLMYVGLDGQ